MVTNGRSLPFGFNNRFWFSAFESGSKKESNAPAVLGGHLNQNREKTVNFSKARKSTFIFHESDGPNVCRVKSDSERDVSNQFSFERKMEEENNLAQVHSGQCRIPRSGRRNKSHSRHEHKCRRSKHKSMETMLEKIDQLRQKNYLLNKKVTSSGEMLSPFEMNVSLAYQHLKNENDQLKSDIEKLKNANDEITRGNGQLREENDNLKDDVSLLKNLVYKLNVELEKYQTGSRKIGETASKADRLPQNYEKNFLKPVLPLLKAYNESIQEKDDTIKDLESEYRKFNMAFNDLLRENEKLYGELEKKFIRDCGGVESEVKLLKKDLEMAKQENNLLSEQIKLEKEKLVKLHSVFKVKVEEVSKEKEDFKCEMEESKSELLVLKGKYAVLKQEFDRLKMENDTRVPLSVHSASVNECRSLFQELKSEYENENRRSMNRIKELEVLLAKQGKKEEKWSEERNVLEKSNFNQTFEIETLMRKISELESQLSNNGKAVINEKSRKELNELRKQLGEANQRIEGLSKKLASSKKQLQKAMTFAEEIVRGQESLLVQLHNKQKENNFMSAQFGNLKCQLKDVERGAREDLDTIEEKIKGLESENQALVVQNKKLEKLLTVNEELAEKKE